MIKKTIKICEICERKDCDGMLYKTEDMWKSYNLHYGVAIICKNHPAIININGRMMYKLISSPGDYHYYYIFPIEYSDEKVKEEAKKLSAIIYKVVDRLLTREASMKVSDKPNKKRQFSAKARKKAIEVINETFNEYGELKEWYDGLNRMTKEEEIRIDSLLMPLAFYGIHAVKLFKNSIISDPDINNFLTENEMRVLIERYGTNIREIKTFAEIGQEMNLSRERIRQIEGKAIRKLIHPSRQALMWEFINKKQKSK